MFKKLIDHLKKLGADLKPMTFRQKLDHLWTYYKEVLFTAAIVVLIICVVISSIINLNTQTLAYGILGNVSSSADGYAYLTEDFFEDLGGVAKKQEVVLDSVAFEDAALSEDVEMNYNASMRLLAMVSAELVDYMLLDHYTMEFYMADDFYMDMRDLLPEAELEQMKSDMIYAQPEGYDEMFPVAIDVSELPYVKAHIRTGDDDSRVYLAFAANTKRPEICLELWQRLKAWQPEE